jgi:trehalose 6-phosphate phosphatase
MPEGDAPPDALTRLDELARWVGAAEGVVLGIDFDGTLSALTDDPDEPTLTHPTRPVFERVASAPTVAPAVVSGRARDDLVPRVDVDGVVYAGNHGLELAYDDWTAAHPAAARHRETIQACCDRLADELAGIPGSGVENKGLTATVHFRRTPDEDVPAVVRAVDRVAAAADGVRVTAGKQVRELRPPVEWDKGRALRLLTDQVPDGWRVLYVGDDRTDEDAFRAIQPDGIGVRVVTAGRERASVETDATYRLDGQRAVARLLTWLGVALDSSRASDASADPWARFLRSTGEVSTDAPDLFVESSPPTGR